MVLLDQKLNFCFLFHSPVKKNQTYRSQNSTPSQIVSLFLKCTSFKRILHYAFCKYLKCIHSSDFNILILSNTEIYYKSPIFQPRDNRKRKKKKRKKVSLQYLIVMTVLIFRTQASCENSWQFYYYLWKQLSFIQSVSLSFKTRFP